VHKYLPRVFDKNADFRSVSLYVHGPEDSCPLCGIAGRLIWEWVPEKGPEFAVGEQLIECVNCGATFFTPSDYYDDD